jgi:hypothetical protein
MPKCTSNASYAGDCTDTQTNSCPHACQWLQNFAGKTVLNCSQAGYSEASKRTLKAGSWDCRIKRLASTRRRSFSAGAAFPAAAADSWNVARARGAAASERRTGAAMASAPARAVVVQLKAHCRRIMVWPAGIVVVDGWPVRTPSSARARISGLTIPCFSVAPLLAHVGRSLSLHLSPLYNRTSVKLTALSLPRHMCATNSKQRQRTRRTSTDQPPKQAVTLLFQTQFLQ